MIVERRSFLTSEKQEAYNMAVLGHYECSDCGRRLKKGEFMAIIGKTPSAELRMPAGRADTIFRKVGGIYCGECFLKRFTKK